MNDLVFLDFLRLEMWNVERTDGIHRREERAIELVATSRRLQLFPHSSQCPQNAGAIETLPLAMVAETHRNIIPPIYRDVVFAFDRSS
jgi:hypothetical protein